MIQDIGKRHFDNSFRVVAPTSQSYVLAFRGNKALMRIDEDGTLALPRLADWDVPVHDLFCRYLFAIDDQLFFLAENELAQACEGFCYESLYALRRAEPRWLAFADETAYQLYGWYRDNRYCGRCGAELGHVLTSRELACASCGNVVYPRINPAVIVGVTNGDSILLTRYARGYRKPALVAGFTEFGETLEGTVHREVGEEVGLTVTNLRYYKSQPWSFTDTLLSGFFCDVEGDPSIHVDHDELSWGEWVRRDDLSAELGGRYDTSSLTNEMIALFARGGEPKAEE